MGLLRLVIFSSVVTAPNTDPNINSATVYEMIERAVSFAQAVTAVPRSELLSTGLDERLRDCGANVECMSTELADADVDRALLVVVNFAATPSLLSLRLVETWSKRVLASSLNECDRESCELEKILRLEVGGILQRGGHAIGGRLIVETIPPEARVELEPNESARIIRPGTFALAPGVYTVKAALEDHVGTSTRATVFRQRETELSLRLEREANILDSPLFWGISIGAVVAAVGVTAAVLWPSAKNRVLFCPGRPADDCGVH